MHQHWHDSNKAAVVVRKLAGTLGLNTKGEVTLGVGPDADNGFELIATLFRFADAIPANIRLHAARRAVIDSRKANSLAINQVAARLLEQQKAYLQLPQGRYVLVTTISLRARNRIPRIVFDGASISFAKLRPGRFTIPDRVSKAASHYGPPPDQYWSAWVSLSSRDSFSAGVRALRMLDFWRGVWNFCINHRTWRVVFPEGTPYNKVMLGPIQTLHLSDGSSADDLAWWDPGYVQPLQTVDADYYFKAFSRFANRVRRALKLSPHHRTLREALIRYARALDERDRSACFLHLWSLLEDLTATQNADHATTVRRVTFLSPDPEFNRLSFDLLRRWRNRIVHEGESADDALRMVNEVKSYAEELLLLLMREGRRFNDMNEFGKFLDSPTEPQNLRRRQSQLRLALKVRS